MAGELHTLDIAALKRLVSGRLPEYYYSIYYSTNKKSLQHNTVSS